MGAYMNTQHRKNKSGFIILLCIFMAVITTCVPYKANAKNLEGETIRVGYYPVSDYQDKTEDGTLCGFSYDYFVQIQKYTRWKYEFVEASYVDCLKMLADGEIDVMSGLTSTPEREKLFIFSEYSISNTQSKLYAREDNKNLFYESYDTFDGCKIGIISGYKTDELEAYCKAHEFDADMVQFSSYAEMEAALLAGDIDIICGSSVPDDADTKIVARLKKQPLYYAVAKDRQDVADELDNALQKIIDNNPEFYTQMSEKYKINGANASATFTREEEDYIASDKQIYLVVNDNWAPITFYDKKTGEYSGIAIDVAKEIENYSGLDITPITGTELDNMVKNNPDVMGNTLVLTSDDTAWVNEKNLMMSNHVVDASIVMISKNGRTVDVSDKSKKVALTKDYYISFCIEKELAGREIVYYDTVQECLDAVNNGKADFTYVNTLSARYYLSMLKYTNLYIAMESGYTEHLAFGVYTDSETPLLSILDKTLLCIGNSDINQIVVQYSHADESFSLEGLFYTNPMLVIAIILVFCILIGFILFFRLKAVSVSKITQKEKTLARFMGYVCAANDNVLDVNLRDFTAESYVLDEDGNVVIKDFPYHQINHENYQNQILPEDYQKILDELSEEALDEMIDYAGGEKYFECRTKAEDNQYHWYAYSLQAIPKDEEHPRNFILFKRNIDSVKKEEEKNRQILEDALETAKAANEAKGNFLSRVSHEIRTPLNAIIGFISIARQPDSDLNKIEHCLENSDIASRHLLAILNDVLDMSSIENGKLKLAKETFSVKEVMANLDAVYKEQASGKNIAFELETGNISQEWIVGDKMRVNQILFNLVSNAIKFTEKGKVKVTFTQMDNLQGKCQYKFEVSDTGIGMSEEYMKRLFKPFEQENAKTAQKFGGTGLGLSIAWNLVTMMGGSIEVYSRLGEGTKFTVLLSFELGKSQNTVIENEMDFAGIRAIAVNASIDECNSIKAMLKQNNIKCDTTTSFDKALQRIESRKGGNYEYKLCVIDAKLIKDSFENSLEAISRKADGDIKFIITVDSDETALTTNNLSMTCRLINKPLIQSSLFNIIVELFGKSIITKHDQTPMHDFSGVRLLLAEDNEMNLEIAVEVLRRAGLIVDTASDGKEAVDKFVASDLNTYQIILMDIQMPVMDGYEATRQIRASHHPQAESIPIIAATANAFSEDVAAALACGMNNHISKPIDYKKLYTLLEKYIVSGTH